MALRNPLLGLVDRCVGAAQEMDMQTTRMGPLCPRLRGFAFNYLVTLGLERSRPVAIRCDTRKAEVLERKWPKGTENGDGRLDLELGLGPAVLGEAWASWPRPWPHHTATSSPVAGASGCGYN